MKIGVIENKVTGSSLEYDSDNPPHYTLSYVNVRDGQLVYNRVPLATLPDIVQEFLAESFPGRPLWLPVGDAPISTPAEQEWFLAVCPDDNFSPLGTVHVACRYEHDDPGYVRVVGSSQPRKATGWMPAPLP